MIISEFRRQFPRIAILLAVICFSASPARCFAAQASNLSGFHRSGQTFLTWDEIAGAGVTYHIYRGTSPFVSPVDLTPELRVATVGQDTSLNARASAKEGGTRYLVITAGQPALADTKGLYVHTPSADGAYYYAVTAVDGAEATTIGSNAVGPIVEMVSMPEPVLQHTNQDSARRQDYFVHWVANVDTPLYPAMHNVPYGFYNFRVIRRIDAAYPDPRPMMLHTHARGGSYNIASSYDNVVADLITLVPDSLIFGSPLATSNDNDFWYGFNSDVPKSNLTGGVDMNYTTRRLAYYLDWMISGGAVDENRIFATGGSMGAIGAAFNCILLRDKLAAGLGIVPRFNFRYFNDTPWPERLYFDRLWGTEAQNIMSNEGIGGYDRMNAGYLATNHPEWDIAPYFAYNGRQDTVVGWKEKPPFYAAVEASRHGWFFFWDNRNHNGMGATWNHNDLFAWMLNNLRRDQSFPAFSNCSVNNNPGNGDKANGDIVGTINGYLTWDPATILDTLAAWAMDLALRSDAPAATCTVDVTPRRLQAFTPSEGEQIDWSAHDIVTQQAVGSGSATVAASGRVTIENLPLNKNGVRLTLERTIDLTPPDDVTAFQAVPGDE